MNYLSLVAVYSLFHVFVKEELSQRAAKEVASVNEKPFGAFATLTRGPKFEVHGCIGNWSSTFQEVSSGAVVTWLQQLVLDARHKDQRRLQFPTDINEDVTTTLTITVMLLPVYPVNADTGMLKEGEVFKNKKYGLIFQGHNGPRATYLPDVFQNATWEHISTSLIRKAGLTSKEQGHFYAYKTLSLTLNVYQTLFSVRGNYFLEQDVALFYEKYFQDFVPYEFDAKKRQVFTDKSQAVRNVASLVDVLQLSEKFNDSLNWTSKPVLQNLDFYFKKWYSFEQDFTQASIFLLKAYTWLFRHGMKMVQKRVAVIEEGLYEALLTLEPQFAMGEAVSTLAPVVNAATPLEHVDKLMKACTLMRSRLENFKISRIRRRNTLQLDLVFELNWQSQSAHRMLQLALTSFPEHVPFFHEFVSELSEMILLVIQNTLPATLETNYLVVVFECLGHLESGLGLTGEAVPVRLQQKKFQFFTTLLQDRRGAMGLYYFKNSNVARLDLTGHTLQ